MNTFTFLQKTLDIYSNITQQFQVVALEDINIRGMLKNHHLVKALSDMSLYEFRRHVEYKAQLRGVQGVIVDRWFPSSKTCFCCRYIFNGLTLSEREWTCPRCGKTHDHDVNAAINLSNFAVSSTVSAM